MTHITWGLFESNGGATTLLKKAIVDEMNAVQWIDEWTETNNNKELKL